jgi:hypothetical protein
LVQQQLPGVAMVEVPNQRMEQKLLWTRNSPFPHITFGAAGFQFNRHGAIFQRVCVMGKEKNCENITKDGNNTSTNNK